MRKTSNTATAGERPENEYTVTAQLVTRPAAIHMRDWKLNFSGGRYTITDGQGGVIFSIKDGVIPHSDVTPILLVAPEMLEALEICATTLETVYQERDPKNMAAKCAAQRARGVIAKARKEDTNPEHMTACEYAYSRDAATATGMYD